MHVYIHVCTEVLEAGSSLSDKPRGSRGKLQNLGVTRHQLDLEEAAAHIVEGREVGRGQNLVPNRIQHMLFWAWRHLASGSFVSPSPNHWVFLISKPTTGLAFRQRDPSWSYMSWGQSVYLPPVLFAVWLGTAHILYQVMFPTQHSPGTSNDHSHLTIPSHGEFQEPGTKCQMLTVRAQ